MKLAVATALVLLGVIALAGYEILHAVGRL